MTDFEMRPTVKSAIMFEEITGNDFFSTGRTDEEALVMMYCAYVCSVGMVSFDAFKNMLNNKQFASQLSTKWLRYERFMKSFRHNGEAEAEDKAEGTEEVQNLSMKEIAKLLVFKYGLDPDYVFNKIELWEMDYLIKIGEASYRDNAEEKRMWMFFQMSPHFDPKKANTMTPAKMFPFPWEKEAMEKELKKESARAKNTIGQKMKIEF